MLSFRHVIALVLLAIWLPATMHCGLELAFSAPAESCCHAGDSNASDQADHCGIEDGNYRATQPENLVAAPVLMACWVGPRMLVNPAESGADSGHPRVEAPALSRTWQFEVRAAWPANAPSVVS